VNISIDGIAHGGDGVGRLNGKAVFVPGALPGETVTVVLTEERARFARGRLIRVVTAASERVTPPCVYVGECGGCDLQHVSADGQARLKKRVVSEQLMRLGGIADPVVTDVLQPTQATGYRSQVRLQVTDTGELGFYAAQSHTVIPIQHCLVAHPGVQAARDTIGTAPGAVSVTIRSFTDGQASVTLEPADVNQATFAATVARLKQAPNLTVADRPDDAALDVTVGNHVFTVPAGAFFQASAAAAEAITHTVLKYCGDCTDLQVVDLYAGIGLFSVPLSHQGAKVTAVEAHRIATQAARTNTANTPQPVRVVTDTVERFLATNTQPFDVVVLDPPRSGAGAHVIKGIVALARDTRTLTQAGYTLVEATPIDAFPMTHHIEIVAAFHLSPLPVTN